MRSLFPEEITFLLLLGDSPTFYLLLNTFSVVILYRLMRFRVLVKLLVTLMYEPNVYTTNPVLIVCNL